MKRSILALILSASLCGCSSDLADTVKALAADNATSCLDLTIATPWGTQKATYARSNSSASSAASDTAGCAFNHGGSAPTGQASPRAPVTTPSAPTAPAQPSVAIKPLASIWKPDLVSLMQSH